MRDGSEKPAAVAAAAAGVGAGGGQGSRGGSSRAPQTAGAPKGQSILGPNCVSFCAWDRGRNGPFELPGGPGSPTMY